MASSQGPSAKGSKAGPKEFGQHTGLDALTASLAGRYDQPTDPEPANAATPGGSTSAPTSTTPRPAPAAADTARDGGRGDGSTARAKLGTRGTGMSTRSWYLREDVADALAATADELYYDLRGKVPKHQVLAAIIAAGIDQADTVRDKLSHISQNQQS